jgi:hypothetical protein
MNSEWSEEASGTRVWLKWLKHSETGFCNNTPLQHCNGLAVLVLHTKPDFKIESKWCLSKASCANETLGSILACAYLDLRRVDERLFPKLHFQSCMGCVCLLAALFICAAACQSGKTKSQKDFNYCCALNIEPIKVDDALSSIG